MKKLKEELVEKKIRMHQTSKVRRSNCFRRLNNYKIIPVRDTYYKKERKKERIFIYLLYANSIVFKMSHIDQ